MAGRANRLGAGGPRPPLLREGYGPTLGELLLPTLRALPPFRRALVWAAGVVVAAGVIWAIFFAGPATVSLPGPPPFSFSPGSLRRLPAQAGEYVRFGQLRGGRLVDFFAVAPFPLPPYTGSVTGVLPLVAEQYRETVLRRRYPTLQVSYEGPLRTDAFGAYEELPPSTVYYHVTNYAVAFTAESDGAPAVGRAIFLLPPLAHPRAGLVLLFFTVGHSSPRGASVVGVVGPLGAPLRSFSFR